MPKLPQISGRKIVKLLEKQSWVVVSQKGSHVKLTRETELGRKIVIVPDHKTLKKGTLSNILKMTQLKF